MDTKCFYENGLNFSCIKGCKDCCANEPGLVFLSNRDIDEIAKAVELPRDEAIAVYTRPFETNNGEKLIVLKEYSNNNCIFLGENGCTIYPHRPLQCITYPFWNRIISSEDAWNNEAKMCKGINNKDGFVKKEDIEFLASLFEFPATLE